MKTKSYSVVSALRGLTILMFIMILLNFTYSVISLIQIRERNYNTAEFNLKHTALTQRNRLKAIESFSEWLILNDTNVETIASVSHAGEILPPLRNLRNLIKERYSSLGEKTMFFLYIASRDELYNISSLQTDYEEYRRLESFLRSHTLASNNRLEWKVLSFTQGKYICFQVNYNGMMISALLNIEELAEEYNASSVNIPLGIEIVDDSKATLYTAQRSLNDIFTTHIELSAFESTLPYDIRIYSTFFDNYGDRLILQFTLISLFLLLAVFSCFYLSRLYNRIIRPIESFHENLTHINNNSDTILKKHNIKELEQTSLQFRALLSEINKLKIDMYEHELEKTRSELEILQHQIKPHFYLNCLSTISSMIQVGENDLAEKMIRFTSIYLRYLFQSENKYAQLLNELEHIDAYLNIQSLRLYTPISYNCMIEDDCRHVLIPPLLMITFVENSVKHGASPDKPLSIVINISHIVKEDIDWLQFDLIDNGPGFSKESLIRLSGDNIYSPAGGHIGIKNSLKRLELIYGKLFTLDFFNNDESGAHVRLLIPYQIEMED